MKDEIKEILDYLEDDKNYNCDCNDGSYYLELPYREAQELKDCIINLLKETNELKEQQRFLYHIRQDTTSIPAVVRKASDVETIKELQQKNFSLEKEIKNKEFLLKSQGEELKELYSVNLQLVDNFGKLSTNWNKLREYCKETDISIQDILDKIQELEKVVD